MLNKFTGWLIFVQLGYVSLFVAASIINSATDGEVANKLQVVRKLVGLSNQHVRLNDYVCYPLALTAPINMFLALLYFWNLLRKNQEIHFTESFFNNINAVYVAAGSWLFTSVFCSLVN